MSYWLHPSAERELTEAALYYSRQASGHVASAFLVAFERVIAVLGLNQQLGTPVAESLRIHPFRRFPYSVVYREAEFGPEVFAIAHQKREPGYWQGRSQP